MINERERMKSKPVIGQVLYRLRSSWAGRQDAVIALEPVTVVKVGHKYFTIESEDSCVAQVYDLETWSEKTEFTSRFQLYASEQEYKDELEHSAICKEIYEAFNWHSNMKGKISLEALRQIKAILEKGTGKTREAL